MKKIKELEKKVVQHITSKDDTEHTDRQMLTEVHKELKAYIENNKVKPEATCEAPPPQTVYALKMSRMTMEEMATMGVKLITVNSSELFWVTSVGHLYPFDRRQEAIEAEYAWLNSNPN
jgi:hypothetical protein